MKEHSLVASVALFGELYNNDKYSNVTDVLAEFIKGALWEHQTWSVNSTELTLFLQETYEFNIPEAVVKHTLKTKMKKVCQYKDQRYYFEVQNIKKDTDLFTGEYKAINDNQKIILESLYSFIETTSGIYLQTSDKEEVRENFVKYLLDNGYAEKYSNPISSFIIKNQQNLDFIRSLNTIREGLILYQGIRYTSDVNDLGNWNTDLKIFLNTEHLFNAVGYNGEVYKRIFYDFLELTNRINQKSRNKKNEKLIELRYLEETSAEIDEFFMIAESIVKGVRMLDPTGSAMRLITKGCKSPAEVRQKKLNFIKDINQLGITLQETNTSAYNYHEYVAEQQSHVEILKKESKEKGKKFNESEYEHFGRIFTKVNYFRGGKSDTTFEKIGHVFLTSNSFALWLAHNPIVKFKENDIPFAASIEFITCKFWFKLCKGFGDNSALPKSLEVITKAQVILSSQVSSSVSKRYDELQQAYKSGDKDKDYYLALSYDLREKNKMPEDINYDTVDESLDFIDDNNYAENFFRNQELKNKEIIEKEKEIMGLREQVKQLEEHEKKRAEDQEKENLLKQQESALKQYIDSQTANYNITIRENIKYFIKNSAFLLLSAVVIGILRFKPVLDNLDKLGYWSYIVQIILTLLAAVELFRRTYICDKEKMKSGAKLFLLWIGFAVKKVHLPAKIEVWKDEFEKMQETRNDLAA